MIWRGFLILVAAIGASTGELSGRDGTVTYRDEDPKRFWWLAAGCFFVGIFSVIGDGFNDPRDVSIGILFVVVFGLRPEIIGALRLTAGPGMFIALSAR